MTTANEELDDVEKNIRDALHQLRGFAPGREGTARVKRALAELGMRMGWDPWPRPDHLGYGWLYDLAWLRYSGDVLADVGLVLESEWDSRAGYENIRKVDFPKLLVARARHRVLVFQGSTERIAVLCDELVRVISTSRLTGDGDKYLFCAWNTDTSAFEFRHHLTQPRLDG